MAFFSTAQIVGYVALILGVAGFLQKSDLKLKLLTGSESLAYTLHFFLLGNPVASASAFVSAMRFFVSVRSRSPVLAVIFIVLNLAAGVFTATSAIGWLLVIFNCVATYGAFMLRGIPMRLSFLSSTVLWLTNNIVSGSIGGTVLESTVAVANTVTIIRMLRDGRAQDGGNSGTVAAMPNETACAIIAKVKAMFYGGAEK
jgi:hypothetical protein